VEVDGTLAYVADGNQGLKILNVNGVGPPTLAGSLSLSGIMRDVTVKAPMVYLANQQGLMEVVLANVPSAPRRLGSMLTSGLAFYVASEGTWAALVSVNPGTGQEYLDMVSISSPFSPVLSGSTVVGPVGTARGVELSGGTAYVAAGGSGLQIYNTAATFQGVADDEFEAGDLAVASGGAAIAGKQRETGKAHLKVIDVSVATAPRLLGEMSTQVAAGSVTGFQDVALNGSGTLAVGAAGWDGVWTIDLSDPAFPELVGSYNTPGIAGGVDLQGTLA